MAYLLHKRLTWGPRSTSVLTSLGLLTPTFNGGRQAGPRPMVPPTWASLMQEFGSAAEEPHNGDKLTSYSNIPPPRPGECPIWTDDVLPPALPARRRIYCNRALNMSSIKAIGFDMDYTLAQYKADTFETLAHKATVDKLICQFQYPDALRSFTFQWDHMMKGLIIDKHRGNILKVDRHKYVKVAMHGFRTLSSEERGALYNETDVPSSAREAQFDEPDYAMVDTLFSLAEAYLFSSLVEYKDKHPDSVPGRKTYAAVYKDLRTAVDWCHRDGSIKKAVAANPSAFIHTDPLLKELLVMLRASGKKVFLATNSQWDYTNVVMNFLLNNKLGADKNTDWLTYFDAVVVACAKPAFFSKRSPLFYVDVKTGYLQNTDNGAPVIAIDEQDLAQEPPLSAAPPRSAQDDDGRTASNGTADCTASTSGHAAVYQGGYYKELHSLLGVTNGSEVLYVGDHIYGDILKSKKTIGWRTMLVVPELELELQMEAETQRVYTQTAVLRTQRDIISDQIQRLEYSFKQGAIRPEHKDANRENLERLRELRLGLKERHTELLRNLHEAFHPVWGQLLKTGHQNSRFAHQMERFACLYTSHVSNMAFVSPDKSYAARMDYMAHEDPLESPLLTAPAGQGGV